MCISHTYITGTYCLSNFGFRDQIRNIKILTKLFCFSIDFIFNVMGDCYIFFLCSPVRIAIPHPLSYFPDNALIMHILLGDFLVLAVPFYTREPHPAISSRVTRCFLLVGDFCDIEACAQWVWAGGTLAVGRRDGGQITPPPRAVRNTSRARTQYILLDVLHR